MLLVIALLVVGALRLLQSLRTWPATWRAQVTLRSTFARCVIRATRSVSGFASASRRPSAWMKTIGGLRRTRYRGREGVQMHASLVAAAYNLVRIARLAPSCT